VAREQRRNDIETQKVENLVSKVGYGKIATVLKEMDGVGGAESRMFNRRIFRKKCSDYKNRCETKKQRIKKRIEKIVHW